MANLYAVSKLKGNSIDSEQNFNLKMTDEQYTQLVDGDIYYNFISDGVGFGIARWKSEKDKHNLLIYAQEYNTSVGNIEMQLQFLIGDLMAAYPDVYNNLMQAETIEECINAIYGKYIKPNKYYPNEKQRQILLAGKLRLLVNDEIKFEQQQKKQEAENKKIKSLIVNEAERRVAMKNMEFSNSELIDFEFEGRMNFALRSFPITEVVIKMGKAKISLEQMAANMFEKKQYTNYMIDDKGRIGLFCPEKGKTNVTGKNDIDEKAVTIMIASSELPCYKITQEAFNALIVLILDIAKRNNKLKVYVGSCVNDGKRDRSIKAKIKAGFEEGKARAMARQEELKENKNTCLRLRGIPAMFGRLSDFESYYLDEKITEYVPKINKWLKNKNKVDSEEIVLGNIPDYFYVRTRTDRANVYKAASFDSEILNVVPVGTVFEIEGIDNGFGIIKDGGGYIYLSITD